MIIFVIIVIINFGNSFVSTDKFQTKTEYLITKSTSNKRTRNVVVKVSFQERKFFKEHTPIVSKCRTCDRCSDCFQTRISCMKYSWWSRFPLTTLAGHLLM